MQFSLWIGVNLAAMATVLVPGHARADGCFVFVWNKQKDINEPTQKAILLYDKGREDLVLQVKYEGPAEDFGWLIPMPGLPEVRKGSMDCFYELSRLTQERFGDGLVHGRSASLGAVAGGEPESVKVIEIKTVGAYEVAVLSTTDANSLSKWLDAHQFVFPKDKEAILDDYIKKQWYFVAAKVNPERNGFTLKSELPAKPRISPATQKKLANGELHPLVISFATEKCIFPLAISAANGKPSEVSLYVLSAEPLMSKTIFEKKFEAYQFARAQWANDRTARLKQREERLKQMQQLQSTRWKQLRPPARLQEEDPADPAPDPFTMRELLGTEPRLPIPQETEDDFYGGEDLVRSMEAQTTNLVACTKELPRLAGKSWWLTKQVQVFKPEEMSDLQFEPAIPALAANLHTTEGFPVARALAQFGMRAAPVLLAALQSPDPTARAHALSALAELRLAGGRSTELDSWPTADPAIVTALSKQLQDPDAQIRAKACGAAAMNWDKTFIPRLTELLRDPDEKVRSCACFALQEHRDDLADEIPTYRKMVEEDGLAAPYAVRFVGHPGVPLSREQSLQMLSSTNLPVVSMGFTGLRRQGLEQRELAPLLTNSLPMARLMGLGELTRIGDKAAVEQIVAMLHDSNEGVRWRVRESLRRLSGLKLGADPAAWEKWWAENKETFVPQSRPEASLRRR
jgi:HEAT repeat protein